MKVLILNKREFNKFMEFSNITDENVDSKDMMFISINNHADLGLFMGKAEIYSYFKRQHSNVMIMHFGDFSEEFVARVAHEGPTGIFTPYKAKKLYNFIKRNKDKSIAICHCGAGISRSGAVGTFIHDLYGTVSYEEFKRKNPRILPNSHILKLLNDEYRKDTK